ncbi:Isopropylmalate/homocitrate/citramalate synthases (LeuA) (PDB:4JN6) [Commensalibacter communis]|uniref:2-isopropylmalate synthase n=1 Tax=Commensalibacter communis TaxID=2972786 RepID=A0A9W4TMI5_9PROT|nr:2-isopropylmalate synthase [Commensalibacter communis]CAI3925758.1 Isopropylmalate/homocitrate/citramalate synthases (LeuA) (PDB:4JN6) [Commensalibacter communis]CAI3926310.1 Isopropylmalate/homocitrate/citramalate synthases (LeuA) (PDB:4JN6) [Commensalibacter communis]CAI3935054.1 Isopropylmalate/homocitrate/citramalate synthases (LeuA) (PDB:4JN6) [Commensalibacter communis]CAI3936691.1 Isopropylmalate/homocitrate/citramalate synthases (LeuA) (PDB:4JN6) [Commensalibacter communis]CAI393672
MLTNPETKYRPFNAFPFPERTWPNNTITKAPIWCAVDMRDGNQSLINPMDHDRKIRFFKLLVDCGFKHIEVGFPSASETEFNFVRYLIDNNMIPEDVTIQVLTAARPELIERTFEALKGAKKVVIHVYNAIAEIFRRIVFNKSQDEIIDMATTATQLVVDHCNKNPETHWTFEYSPENFSLAEIDYAIRICEAVADVWKPSEQRPMIINLPSSVEASTPNVFADQIEYFCTHFSQRDKVCISVHPHNDRGTAIATAELSLLAGADRIEGCLFGNGERTGNADLVVLALNLYSQGIHPNLDFHDIKHIGEVVKECNELPIHPRHPYVGDLVFSAFSGSHQDAIKKGFQNRQKQNHTYWEMPYLPIDPADLGCSYEAVIRVNSQSGKSGAAWILQQNHGIELPPHLQREFSTIIQQKTDQSGHELTPAEIWSIFREHYGLTGQNKLTLQEFNVEQNAPNSTKLKLTLNIDGKKSTMEGEGNGVLSAGTAILKEKTHLDFRIVEYNEHTLGKNSDSRSISYIKCSNKTGESFWGVAIDNDILSSSLKALLNAVSKFVG